MYVFIYIYNQQTARNSNTDDATNYSNNLDSVLWPFNCLEL